MSERKVLNKYIPPTFDPTKILRRRGPGEGKKRSHTVRLMAPFSMCCNTCGEYVYKGKKFNARKETLHNEDYLGIVIFRFYIRCPRCSAEITFKTDPKNLDYAAETGASRNFEPWRDEDVVREESKRKRLLEEELDPIKALENKTIDTKRELEIMESLDFLRTQNARKEMVDVVYKDDFKFKEYEKEIKIDFKKRKI